MKRIACVYTAIGLHPIMEKLFSEAVDDEVVFNHIIDSGMIRDVVAADGITPDIEARLLGLFDSAAAIKPDIVVCTCSSIGEVAEKADALHPEVKILRVDEAMAREAVSKYSKIAVMSTLTTTVLPSCRLVERIAREEGKEVTVVSATANGVRSAQAAGREDLALEDIKKTASELCADGAQILLLAQASMAKYADDLHELLGIPVLTSPPECAKMLKKLLAD